MKVLKISTLFMAVCVWSTLVSAASTTFFAGASHPGPMETSLTGDTLFVGCDNGIVYAIRTSDYAVIDSLSIGVYSALDIEITPDGQHLYVSNTVNGYYTSKAAFPLLSVVANVQGGTDPAAIALKSDNSVAYIVCHWSGFLQIVSIPDNTEIGRIGGIYNGALGIVLSPDEQYAYVTVRAEGPNPGPGGVLKIRLVDSVIVGETPNIAGRGVAVTPDGNRIWVTSSFTNDVYIIDAASMDLIDSIVTSPNPDDIVITPDGKYCVITNTLSDVVTCISIERLAVLSTAATGHGPHGIILSPDGLAAYISNSLDNTITEVNVQDLIPSGPWSDDFEMYAEGNNLPSPPWYLSGNPVASVESANAINGTQSVRLYGITGGCWGSLAMHPLGLDLPMSIAATFLVGSEDLSGCHPYRASLDLKDGTNWWDPTPLSFFAILEDGRMWTQFGTNDTISGLPLDTAFNVRIDMYKPGDGSLHGDFYINSILARSYSIPEAAWMDSLRLYNLDIAAQEGTVWFDDVCVAQAPPLATVIWIDSTTVADGYSQVMMLNWDYVSALTIPLIHNSQHPIDSVSRVGCRTADWELFPSAPNNVNNTVVVGGLANTGGGTQCMSPGEGPIARIYWHRSCEDSSTVEFDTTFISQEAGLVITACTTPPQSITPAFIKGNSTYFPPYIFGDADCSGSVNISDAVYLVQYIFAGGSSPTPQLTGDVNGDCQVNITDVVYLVQRIFAGGPAPIKGCSDPQGQAKVSVHNVNLVAKMVTGDNVTTLTVHSDAIKEIQGLQLEYKTSGDVQILRIQNNTVGLQEFHGTVDGLLKVGLLDLNGKTTIPTGENFLIAIDYIGSGEIELLSAIVVASDGSEMKAKISAERSSAQVPTAFALSQNTPNPFNPTTTIHFAIYTPGQLNLEVLNVLGQKVCTLVDEFKAAGNYSVVWDGRDDYYRSVASGVYFYRISAAEYTETRKMILMK